DKYYNLKAHIIDGSHGIYLNNQKIASLGLRIKQGKSYHGIAIHTNMDLTPFSYINPCGYSGLKMCQLSNFYQEADIKKVQQQDTAEFVTLLNNSI
ncbi:lipoyl protein ligase domain-containing protein, partial [Francisella tularensis]|uniref:lipoyl protein ligase domain-containing protein n=1 Tax=Francisella tularensis TaxID=263 RepID=UPI0023ABD92A|nr:lipoyl(octanoyl) transferase LipB [Francisella tularensis subsp. holarctica]